MPATRSTAKHQRKTQNIRQNIARQDLGNYYRCSLCHGLFSRYHNAHQRHIELCEARTQALKDEEARILEERYTPTPEPYTRLSSSEDFGFGLEADLDEMNYGVPIFGACESYSYANQLTLDHPILPPTLEIGGAEPPLQGNPPEAGPATWGNQITTDPSLEASPPPSDPSAEFGIEVAAACEELGPLQLGQTLVIYHPFAGQPPEIIETANLAWTQEPNPPSPSEEPWEPFGTRADFEQAEFFLHHNCTNSMINGQLQLNHKVSPGVFTMKNAREMHKILTTPGQHQDTLLVSVLQYFSNFEVLTWEFSSGVYRYQFHILTV
jgi:hypothetical protein